MEFEDQNKEIPKLDHDKNDDIDQKEDVQTPPVDRFTGFMFGTRPSRRNNDQKEEAQAPPVNRFTEFMFGTRPSGRNNDQQQTNTEMDDVDYFTLLEQIDDIMVSLKELKPMLKQFSPLMDYIKKKI